MDHMRPESPPGTREAPWHRVVEAMYLLSLAGFLFSVHNKSATALNNIGLYLPFILWWLRLAWREAPRELLGDALMRIALAFTVLLGLSCLWSPDGFESLSWYRKEVAAVALVGFTLAEAGFDRRTLERWTLVLAIAGTWIAIQEAAAWWSSAQADGRLLPPYGRLRDYGYGIVFALPFLLLARANAGRGLRLAIALLVPGLAVLVVATGARGSWIAFFLLLVGGGLWLNARALAAATLACALAGACLFTWLEPDNPITSNVRRGWDTSFRMSGAWSPAAAMIAERPVAGFGYGKFVFDAEYNARKPAHPEWQLPENIGPRSAGPHSLFFEIGFAAGFAGLAAYAVLLAFMAGRAWTLATGEPGWIRSMARAVLLSFAGQYFLYGFIESISWHPLGVQLGLLLALSMAARHRSTAMPARP